jgi:hypothetical protein
MIHNRMQKIKIAEEKTKGSELNGGKDYPNLSCPCA